MFDKDKSTFTEGLSIFLGRRLVILFNKYSKLLNIGEFSTKMLAAIILRKDFKNLVVQYKNIKPYHMLSSMTTLHELFFFFPIVKTSIKSATTDSSKQSQSMIKGFANLLYIGFRNNSALDTHDRYFGCKPLERKVLDLCGGKLFFNHYLFVTFQN